MKIADSLAELYKKYFETDDYLPLFVHSIIEQMDHKDLLQIVKHCQEEQLQEFVANYIIDQIQHTPAKPITPPTTYSNSSEQQKAL
ncbi:MULTISPECIES: DUF6154 family protein [Pontibacillus]|uniref:DUF6154 family protein n=1 Tax=Pontibacillus chungwhensis TaxID=265426 RepID=A0ABY8UVF2_9BACI|nr:MULTISPECIES: DUF6154 family protein [Pontibacillus]MCD5325057.1 DUF6154 family protein [Pontibacillus sp. HN14]WIF97310.1 DUF6154 family protein [Pontibacillus chungwhensis]